MPPPKKSSSTTNVGGFEFASSGNAAAAASTEPKPKKINKRLMRQGAEVTSKADTVIDGVTVKEWQRLPRMLLQELCQRDKRPKAFYPTAKTEAKSKVKVRCILPDPKGKSDKDINVCPNEEFDNVREAEHCAALLMLYQLTPTLPYEKKLPEPYATTWLSLRTPTPQLTLQSKFLTTGEREQRQEEHRHKQNIIEQRQDQQQKQYTQVYMSEANRQYVESIISTLNKMQQQQQQQQPTNGDTTTASAPAAVDHQLVARLASLGFDHTDSLNAVQEITQQQSATIDSALDWLMLNVPEQRLPHRYNPQGKQLEVISNSSDAFTTVLGACRMSIPMTICQQRLKQASNDLFQALLTIFREIYADIVKTQPTDGVVDATEEIENELLALESIYEHQFQRNTTDKNTRRWSVKQPQYTVELIVPLTCSYPHELPIVVLHSDALSAHQSLHIVQRIAKELSTQQLIGSPITSEVVSFLDTNWTVLLDERNYQHPKAWGKYVNPRVLTDQQREQLLHASDSKEDQPVVKANKQQSRLQHKQPNTQHDKALIEQLHNAFTKTQQTTKYQQMLTGRQQLPVYQKQQHLLQLIDKNQVVIVQAATGSGKSTQIPQLVLDHHITTKQYVNIICTQPRRISAIGLAERVSAERCEDVGRTVGYRVRLDNKVSAQTRLAFVTVGILLRQLTSDSTLRDVTHVVIDEVHERSLDIDLLLLIVKRLLQVNPSIKLILMSATLDANIFAQYFKQSAPSLPPSVSIEGRMFPVTEHFVEDFYEASTYKLPQRYRRGMKQEQLENAMSNLERLYNDQQLSFSDQTMTTIATSNEDKLNLELIESLVWYICEDQQYASDTGGILVFLPGVAEINKLQSALTKSLNEHDELNPKAYLIVPLHGSLTAQQQRKVFDRVPRGTRKIVLATNIAETSITVDDIVYVIDTGKQREITYDPATKMTALVDSWCSHANCKQRAGRAGRVKSGHVFRTFSRMQWTKLASHQLPEIKRTPLEHVVLQIMLLGLDHGNQTVGHVLRQAIEPPPNRNIDSAVNTLMELGALTAKSGESNASTAEQLTPLGRHLAILPVGDTRIGKLLLYGAMLGCTSPTATIAALMSVKSPFLSPPDKRDEANEARKRFQVGKSDFLTVLRAYDAWKAEKASRGQWAAKSFAQSNFLSDATLETADGLISQYVECLADIGFVSQQYARKQLYDRSTMQSKPPITNSTFSIASSGSIKDTERPAEDQNSTNNLIVNAALTAALYPRILKAKLPKLKYQQTLHGAVASESEAREIHYYIKQSDASAATAATPATATEQRVFLHPRSVNFHTTDYDCPFLIYSSIQAGSTPTDKIYVHDCSTTTAYSLLLFGGNVTTDHDKGLVVVDERMKFRAPAKVAVLVKQLRLHLHNLLQRKIQQPELSMSAADTPVIDAIIRLLSTQGM